MQEISQMLRGKFTEAQRAPQKLIIINDIILKALLLQHSQDETYLSLKNILANLKNIQEN